MHETQVIGSVALIADDQTTEVAHPGEERFDFPPAPIPAKRTAILRLGTGAAPSMGRNHLDA